MKKIKDFISIMDTTDDEFKYVLFGCKCASCDCRRFLCRFAYLLCLCEQTQIKYHNAKEY